MIPLLLSLATATAAEAPPALPLSTGAAWIYRGTVHRIDPRSECTGERPCRRRKEDRTWTWTVEVGRTVRHGQMTLAALKGFLDDLVWYADEAPARGDYLLVCMDDGRVYLLKGQDGGEIHRWLEDPSLLLPRLIERHLLLVLPLVSGEAFGCEEGSRGDYCRMVGAAAPFKPRASAAPPPAGAQLEYSLTYRTRPDDQAMKFVPGVGITSYDYHHHGTLYDVHMSLLRYRPPASPVPPRRP